MPAGEDNEFSVTLRGTTVSVLVNGQQAASHTFNAVVVDGEFGLYTEGGDSSFASVTFMTDDPQYADGAPNTAPVAGDDEATVAEDGSLVVSAAWLLLNDTDGDGDTLSIGGIGQPAHGTLTNNGDGTWTYRPVADYAGSDQFSYSVTDGQGGSASAIVRITVTPANDAPSAGDDQFETETGVALVITAADLLGNDTDVDGDALSVTAVTQPANGSLADNGDGTWTYTSAAGFEGEDGFSYTISDGQGGSATGAVTVLVTAAPVQNDPPTAGDDMVSVAEDSSVVITAADLLGNDSDPDGDALTIVGVTSPAHGTLTDNGDGTWTYRPAADYYGADAFTYEVSDGRGGTATGTVNLTVTPVNDLPTAGDDAFTTSQNTALAIPVSSLLANDGDADGDALTLVSFTQPASGSVIDNGDGTLTYTPASGFFGAETFTYTVGDGNGGSATATVTLTVRQASGRSTYSVSPNLAIGNQSTVESMIDVADSYTIMDLNVRLNITHEAAQDLDVYLVAPDGTRIELFTDVGGNNDNFTDTVLDDAAAVAIVDASAPFTGTFRPEGDLAALEGKAVNGTWTLEITDDKRRNTGTLDNWSLEIEWASALNADALGSYAAAASLTTDDLAWAVDAARASWVASGELSAAQEVRLAEVGFETVDLIDTQLGLATWETVYIDVNAAGHGWIVGESGSGIDLLTVVRHELGHVLGLDHADQGLMSATLEADTRTLSHADEEGRRADTAHPDMQLGAFLAWAETARGLGFLNESFTAARTPTAAWSTPALFSAPTAGSVVLYGSDETAPVSVDWHRLPERWRPLSFRDFL
jgi:subtilisin-like proprotein convertase family protein/surface antigen